MLPLLDQYTLWMLGLMASLHFRRTTTSMASPRTKVKGEGLLNASAPEEDAETADTYREREAPVILVPGHNQDPDPNPATVTQAKEDRYSASTVRRATTNKRDVSQESKTVIRVSEVTVLAISLNSRATDSTQTDRVMRVKVKCIRFFTFGLNDPSH